MLFRPLSACIRAGDLYGFDAALAAGEEAFVKRRIYLTLERGRDIALRNLLRKVFLAGGFEANAKENGVPPPDALGSPSQSLVLPSHWVVARWMSVWIATRWNACWRT